MRCLYLLLLAVSLLHFSTPPLLIPDSGTLYARAYFPDHPVDALLKSLDFRTKNIHEQYLHLRDSLKIDLRSEGDVMYNSALFLMPVYSVLEYSKTFSTIQQQTLGFSLEAFFDSLAQTGHLVLSPHVMTDNQRIAVKADLTSMNTLWEKQEIDETEYTLRKEAGTTRIAGYTCNKMSYKFNGTSRKPVLHTKLISTIPWTITTWYTGELPEVVNAQLPFRFDTDKAIIRMEVSFDQQGGKKMVWEVTRVVQGLPDEGEATSNEKRQYDYQTDIEKSKHDMILFMGQVLGNM